MQRRCEIERRRRPLATSVRHRRTSVIHVPTHGFVIPQVVRDIISENMQITKAKINGCNSADI